MTRHCIEAEEEWTNAGAAKGRGSYGVIGALYEAAHRRIGRSTLTAWLLLDPGAQGRTLPDKEKAVQFIQPCIYSTLNHNGLPQSSRTR